MMSYEFNDEQKLDVRSNFLDDLLDDDLLQTSRFFFEYLSPSILLFFCAISWSSNIAKDIESSCIYYNRNYCIDNITSCNKAII